MVPQALIQWSDQPNTLATWEGLEELHQGFPRAPAWRQVVFQRGGIIATLPLLLHHLAAGPAHQLWPSP
jgi:hypothetical protein